jgi:hypothetical protein
VVSITVSVEVRLLTAKMPPATTIRAAIARISFEFMGMSPSIDVEK